MKPFRFTSYDGAIERICVVVAVAYASVIAHVGVILVGLFVMPFLLSLLDLARPQVTFAMPEKKEPVALAIIEVPPIPEPPPVEVVEPPKAEVDEGRKRARKEALSVAKNAGILGALSSSSQESSAFASLFATSSLGGEDAFAGLTSGVIGSIEGGVVGGIGVGGLGYRGGGGGEGTIGLGNIGTIGTGRGYGSGYGTLGGDRRASPMAVVRDVRVLEGELDDAIARRSLMRFRPRLSKCAPADDVTVRVQIIIDAGGASTRIEASAGGDEIVRECVARALQSARFPAGSGVRRLEASVALSAVKVRIHE